MTPQLNLLYVHAEHMGYGRMGVNIARELDRMGIEVFDHLEGTTEQTRPTGRVTVKSNVPDHLNTGRHAGRANVACWLSVPGHGTGWWEGQIPVCFTMWEGMRLPESFRETLHRFDTVVVPSTHNLELFSKFHDNVKCVPLGVDPDVWKFTARKPPGTFFNFLIGGSGARKGTDLAVKAFKRLYGQDGSWGDGPIPRLMLKNPRSEQFFHPRIEMHSGRITDTEEVELYESAHCYLQPSRGEGFGLQPLQAIAQGMPTVLTDAHGHASFADLGLGIGWTPKKAEYFIYGDAGEWWEPNLDELCDQMKDVYDHYDDHCARAELSAKEVAERFTWAKTARGLIDAIGPERLTPYVGDEVWFEVDRKLFKVVTLRDWPCEIAGAQHFFVRGTEYWQSADIKRILFEAGVLDPICLDDDDPDNCGLTEEQVAAAGKYRAQYSDCPTCGKALREAEPLSGIPTALVDHLTQLRQKAALG